MSTSSTRINLIDRLSQKMEQSEAKKTDSLIERAMNEDRDKLGALPDKDLQINEESDKSLSPPHIDSSSWHSSESGSTLELDYGYMRSMGLITPDSERSKTKEQFRTIKRPLLVNAFQRPDGAENPHVIMVTSAVPNEGKTFTATNLAMSIAAEQEIKVLLIDGDVIRQDLSKHFGIDNRPGYLDILRGEAIGVSDVLVRTSIPSLALLPAGDNSENATELFAGTRMQDLMQDLASRYSDRVIIVDTPPVLASSETQTLAMHAGQVVLVIEAENTSRQRVEEALSLLPQKERTYCILNKANESHQMDRYGSYRSYYGQ